MEFFVPFHLFLGNGMHVRVCGSDGNGKCVNFRQQNVYASDGRELQLISMGDRAPNKKLMYSVSAGRLEAYNCTVGWVEKSIHFVGIFYGR